MSNIKTIGIVATIAILAAAMITVSYSTAMAQLESKGGGNGKGPSNTSGSQQKKCNNVKIMAVVTGLNTKDTNGIVTLSASATLQGQVVQKTITVNTTDTSSDDGIGIPLFFKKAFEPCPLVGTTYSGNVNSTTFSGALTSISKPNLAQVDMTNAAQAGQPATLGNDE